MNFDPNEIIEIPSHEHKINDNLRLCEWISVKDKLPKDGQQVLIYHKKNNIINIDGTPDKYDCANFCKGEIRPNGPWRCHDVGHGNNELPYGWHNNPMQYFGQDVDYWMELPSPPKENK